MRVNFLALILLSILHYNTLANCHTNLIRDSNNNQDELTRIKIRQLPPYIFTSTSSTPQPQPTVDPNPFGPVPTYPITTDVANPYGGPPEIPITGGLPTPTAISSTPGIVQTTIIKEAAPPVTTLKPTSTDIVYVSNNSNKSVSINIWDMGFWILMTAVAAFLFL